MQIREAGVLPGSNAYFHTPSVMADRLFFTLICTGRYRCSGSYAVKRASYDSYLILYVLQGRGYCYLDGRRVELRTGEMAILDCYRPHRYGTDDGWEIGWLHVDGRLARDYYDAIAAQHRQVIPAGNGYKAVRGLERIHRMFHVDKQISEAVISECITQILTEFLLCDAECEKADGSAMYIEKAIGYIHEHIHGRLTLESLARQVSLSPFYFSRMFKRETGYTLRAYLTHARIRRAQFYLCTTDMTLKEITKRCGYGSESTFCTAFKQVTGVTPGVYRKE